MGARVPSADDRALRVLALASYPDRMAATRFRVSKYLPYLAASNVRVELVTWLDDATAARLYEPGRLPAKLAGSVAGVARELRALERSWDVVWIQREAVLAGPPLVEARIFARRLPVVLDYDDAIWIAQGGPLKRAAKCAWKFDWVLRRAAHAVAGSRQLAERARRFGVPATVLPTTVERTVWTPLDACADRPSAERPLLIGWIGTHTTAPQLSLVAPALRRLRAEGHRFRLRVIGAGPDFGLEGLDVETGPWSLERELDDFRTLDIGITPMFQSEWHEGKCAFKQLQLMAVGVPFVTSLVGGARDFIIDDENALVAHSEEDWYAQLLRLLTDQRLRERLGRAGREVIEERLCIEEQAQMLAQLLRSAAAAAGRS